MAPRCGTQRSSARFSSQLNRYSEQRRAGRPRVRWVPAAEAALHLTLDLRSSDGRVSMAATLADGDRVLEIDRTPGRVLPGRGALLPPLLAIAIALALRRTLLALFVGIYAGAVLGAVERGSSFAGALALGLWDVFARLLPRRALRHVSRRDHRIHRCADRDDRRDHAGRRRAGVRGALHGASCEACARRSFSPGEWGF